MPVAEHAPRGSPLSDAPTPGELLHEDGAARRGWQLASPSKQAVPTWVPVSPRDASPESGLDRLAAEGMTFSANEFIFTSDNGSSQEGATYKIRFDDLFPQDDNSETASSLFFSEYTTGYGSNKYIEIFNPTSSRVELDNYAFPTISNNPTTGGIYEFWNEFPEGATIESGDVYLIADPGAEPAILDQADHLFEYLGDGDDSFAG